MLQVLINRQFYYNITTTFTFYKGASR